MGTPARNGRQSVLIVLPDPPGRPLGNSILEGVQAGLRAADPSISVSADYIGPVGRERPEFEAAQVAWYRTKYAHSRFDALIVVGPPALEALLAVRAALWPGVPIVFTAIDSATYARHHSEPDMTGKLLDLSVPFNIQLAVRLLPDTRRIAVVGGASLVDRYFNSRYPQLIRQTDPKLEALDLTNLGIEELKARVAHLPPHTAIVVLSYLYDPDGRPVFQRDLVTALAPVANAPIFDSADFAMGAGIVGGYLLNFDRMGAEVAALTMRIVAGEPASSIPATSTRIAGYEADARELLRWKIPESRLPSGTTVRFPPFSAWQEYRWWIVAAVAAVGLQCLLIAVLLQERRRARETEVARKQAEVEARLNREEISHLNRLGSMGELAASLAHELNQPLAGILSNAQAAARFLSQQPADLAEVRAALEDIREDDMRAGEVIRRIRQMLKKSRSLMTVLDPNQVARDAVALLRSDANLRKVRVLLETSPDCPKVHGDAVQLQQVVVNLVMNAMEAMSSWPGTAAGGRDIVVRTAAGDGGHAAISVVDHGPGIPAAQVDRIFQPFHTTKQEGLGMGLSISKSIVEAHGGRIWVTSSVGAGATFHVVLPSVNGEEGKEAIGRVAAKS